MSIFRRKSENYWFEIMEKDETTRPVEAEEWQEFRDGFVFFSKGKAILWMNKDRVSYIWRIPNNAL